MNATGSTTHHRKISRWKTAFLVCVLVFTSQACVLCNSPYEDYLRMNRPSSSHVNDDANDLTKVYIEAAPEETQSFTVDPNGSVSLPSVSFGPTDNWREVLEADGYVGIRVPQAPPAYGEPAPDPFAEQEAPAYMPPPAYTPPPASVPSAADMTGTSAKGNNKTLIIVLVVLAVLVLCCCCGIVGVVALFWEDIAYELGLSLLSLFQALPY